MWTARQSIFTDYKIKPETDNTKQPSSPADGSNPLLFFFLFFLSAFYIRQKTAVLPFCVASSKDPSRIGKSPRSFDGGSEAAVETCPGVTWMEQINGFYSVSPQQAGP